MIRTEIREEKFVFPFVQYAPEHCGEKLPLVIQLHGAGERGNGDDLTPVEIHGFTKFIKDKNIKCRFIMPQCPVDTFWAARVESIIEFIKQIMTEFPTDERKVYLTGLSMGGFGTWYTAMAAPDLFAAIVPVCGGGMDWNAGVLKMPIWTFHGMIDSVVNPQYSEMMVKKLESLNADVKFTRLENVGHDAWNYTYNQELIDWLLSKQK